jgi:hypothetical protein
MEHCIILIGIRGKVLGIDQGYYGGSDHIFDATEALEDEHLDPESKLKLEKAVKELKEKTWRIQF